MAGQQVTPFRSLFYPWFPDDEQESHILKFIKHLQPFWPGFCDGLSQLKEMQQFAGSVLDVQFNWQPLQDSQAVVGGVPRDFRLFKVSQRLQTR